MPKCSSPRTPTQPLRSHVCERREPRDDDLAKAPKAKAPKAKAPKAKAPKAKAFFEALDGANRCAVLYRVHTAKKAATRAAWVERVVSMCAQGETIHPRSPTK